mmetsp:Transcript_14572/g.22473  ORF Transcript_14572/g.22473 Transcript_14572/m.22473 type:complete len:433 (+) Transcript_14572:230-1528(+)
MTSLVLATVLLLPELELGKSLVGERARHNKRGVTSGTSQVEETTLSKDNNSLSVLEDETVHLGLDVLAGSDGHKSIHINLVIEVTNVSNNGVVLHLLHALSHKDSLVTGGGDEDISKSNNLLEGGDGVTLHTGLKGTDGINLSNVNNATTGAHGVCATLANISVSADNSLLSSHHDISGAHDTIGKGVLASVQVVEFGLGDRIVNVDGGEEEGVVLLHHIETVDTGGGLLGDSLTALGNLVPLVSLTGLEKTLDDGKHDLELGVVRRLGIGKGSVLKEGVLGLLSLVDEEGHISTIIDDDVHTVSLTIILGPGDSVQGALPVLLEGLSLPGKDGSRLVTSNGCGSVILSGENVARAPPDVGTELLQSLDEDGSLHGHVEGSRDTGSGQRLVGLELLNAAHESRHLDLGNLDLLAAVVGKGNISNFVISSGHV